MTIANTDALAGPFTPNGVTTVFPFAFKAFSKAELRVFSIDSNGVEVDVSSSLYNASINANGGGSVIFPVAPAASLGVLYIESSPAFTQNINFENQSAFRAPVHTEGFDRSAAKDIWLRRRISRAFSIPLSGNFDGKFPVVLPGGVAGFASGTGNDPALRADIAAAGGSALMGFQQAGANAIIQSIQAKLRRTIHVDDFRLVPDADDTNAFVRAIASIAATGGEILLDPKKRYVVSASITIASKYPIAIRGGNFGQPYETTGPGIAYTAAMNSVFRVQSPATRGEAGGVWIQGISFYDASYNAGGLTPGLPGTNTIANGVLDLWDAPLSCIDSCQFHFVKGAAIKTDFFVQSSIRSCRIRYCGDAGKNALHLGATDNGYASQAVTVTDCRIEVCYGNAYVFANAFTQSIVIAHCQFEAATVEYPTSNVPFIDVQTDGCRIIGCGINRNLAQAVILRNGRGIVSGCQFDTGTAATESLLVNASRYVIIGNVFTDTRTAASVTLNGINNLFVGNRMYASGGIQALGAGNQVHQNIIDTPTMLGGGYALVLADFCMARGNFFTSPGSPPAVNGVALYGDQSTFTQNGCREWAGKTFIRIEAAAGNANFYFNSYDGSGTFATMSSALYQVASAATVTLPYGPSLATITGTTNITTINAGAQWAGKTITLAFAGVLTVVDGNNLKLAGNFVTTADDTLTLACDGNNWFEVARSVN